MYGIIPTLRNSNKLYTTIYNTMKNKLITSTFLAITTFALLATPVSADVSCQPIYGGGQTCVQTGNVSVDKKLTHPKTNSLVDNIGVNDDKFGPESVVTFQIAVTNTGSAKISRVQVRDIFPQYVDFAAGVGNFDGGSKVLSFDVNDLNPSETRTFNIVGKVVKAENLPVNQGTVCVVNQATAKDASNTGNPSVDNAQLCIQKNLPAVTTQPTTVVETKGGIKVFPPQKVLTTPATGPEMLPLLALIPTGLFGAFLRKKSLIK